MDFLDIVHDKAISQIEKWRADGRKWEEISGLSFFMLDSEFERKMGIFKEMHSLDYDYSQKEWNELVQYIEDKEEPKEKKITKLAYGTKNDAEIATSKRSAWQLYKKKLYSKNWNKESIEEVERSAFEILQMLSQETRETEPIKGLVLGHVQSGKTANIAGLIAMAADYGFNYFIVLTGVIESLRKQTEKRIYDDLNSPGNINLHIIKNPSPEKVSTPADEMDRLNLSNKNSGGKRYLSVMLKNSSRLDDFVRYIYSRESKMKQLKILVIDDEADQASINTKKMEGSYTEEDEKERTAINRHITNLVNGYDNKRLKGVNYISYTATPYANVLNESASYSLYPKDFIISLNPSKDYLGPKQIFGLEEPETNPTLDIVREIPERDTEILSEVHGGEYSYLPPSLINAIQWFFISSVAMKYNGHKTPISMLVHTSHLIADQENIEEAIKDYLLYIKKAGSKKFIKQCENLYLIETSDFTKNDFLAGIPEYTRPESEILNYPSWEIIEKELRALLARNKKDYLTRIKMDEHGEKKYARGIHLCVDNSRSVAGENEHIRLVYPDKLNDPGYATMFIVIGGNTLSRGLTLEGLTTSYFMRNTITSDSLMQMGRWFGFRIGYELYPRIWLNELIKDRFGFVAQLDEELRDDIEEFARIGKSPKDFGIRVKNSPNNAFIQITSKNKMQGAIPNKLNFEGIQKQTILFKNDKHTLQHNIEITEEFLNSLSKPVVNGSRLVWKDVDYDILRKKFFERYKSSDKDIMFSNLSAFIDWCDEADDEGILNDWSVVLSSKGNIENNDNENTWNIQGYNVSKVSRTVLGKRQSDNKTISIGALRSPRDLISDITELTREEITNTKKIKDVRVIREKYGVSMTPQLVIYRIDKNSKPKGSKRRSPLDFDRDIIGISLMIPGMRKTKNVATSLIVKIDSEDNEIEVEE